MDSIERKRIRLVVDLPFLPEHGALEGREFDADIEPGRGHKAWFMGDAGEECAAWSWEYVVIGEPGKDDTTEDAEG